MNLDKYSINLHHFGSHDREFKCALEKVCNHGKVTRAMLGKYF